MYSYEDRIRAVKLYIKLGNRQQTLQNGSPFQTDKSPSTFGTARSIPDIRTSNSNFSIVVTISMPATPATGH